MSWFIGVSLVIDALALCLCKASKMADEYAEKILRKGEEK